MGNYKQVVQVTRDCDRWHEIALEITEMVVLKVLAVTGWSDAFPLEVSVTLMDDDTIYDLNKTWRDIAKATDVLSFPQYDQDELAKLDKNQPPSVVALGDIVISLETMEKQAEDQQKAWQARFIELLVHGTLHLLGYDHEDDANMAEEMYTMEDKILLQFSDNFWIHLPQARQGA